MQKNDRIDILSLVFMPFTGNKSPGAKKGSDEWKCDNLTNIFLNSYFLGLYLCYLGFEIIVMYR